MSFSLAESHRFAQLTGQTDGFNGSEKVFLFEFAMPDTGKVGFNANMPALWVLNAQVPRTSQYGTNPDCSCWTSGYGEFDLFEVLDSGNFRCKSTLHMDPAGGSSDWLQRPVKGPSLLLWSLVGQSIVLLFAFWGKSRVLGSIWGGGVVDSWVDIRGSVFRMTSL